MPNFLPKRGKRNLLLTCQNTISRFHRKLTILRVSPFHRIISMMSNRGRNRSYSLAYIIRKKSIQDTPIPRSLRSDIIFHYFHTFCFRKASGYIVFQRLKIIDPMVLLEPDSISTPHIPRNPLFDQGPSFNNTFPQIWTLFSWVYSGNQIQSTIIYS